MVKPIAPDTAGPPPVPTVEILIPASTEYVRVARLAVTGVASRMNFTYEDIEDIKLAVSEACNNAILHARPLAGADAGHRFPTVRLTVAAHPDRLEIGVTNEGGASPTEMRQATERAVSRRDQTGSELPESGFGLLLIQSLMDAIEHGSDNAHSTTLRMTKYLAHHPDTKASS